MRPAINKEMFKRWIDKIKKKKGDEEFPMGHMADPGSSQSRRMSVPVTSSSLSKKAFFKSGNKKEEVKQEDEKIESTPNPVLELEEEEEMTLPADFA